MISHEKRARGAAIDLDAFLDELRQQGTLESSGAFTLDQTRVRHKLRNFQLAEPSFYVAPLLAAAHLGGANMVEVQVTAERVTLQWDGQPLERFELENLFTTLLDDEHGTRRHMRELAVGLNAACALRPRKLECASGGHALQLLRDGERLVSADPSPGTRIELVYGKVVAMSRAWRHRLLGRFPEQRIIEEHGALCVPHLRVNARPVPLPAPPLECFSSCLIRGGSPRYEASLRELVPRGRPCREVLGEGPHSALITLSRGAVLNVQRKAVVDGLIYDIPDCESGLGIPGAGCLIIAPQLAKSLSASQVVANEAWSTLWAELQNHAMDLAARLCEDWNGLSEPDREGALPALRALARFQLVRGELRRATQATRRVLSFFEGTGPSWPHADALYSALLLQREAEDVDTYQSGCRRLVEWLGPLLGVAFRRDRRQTSDILAEDYRIEGGREAVASAHEALLAVEQRLLGPRHVVTLQRLDQMRRLYALWGWDDRLTPLMARLHAQIDREYVPSLEDQGRYWG